MGLSASQARLLSITARLSQNELHSQQIANSKVRLADKSNEASKEYIQALNATKLMFTTYDAKGNETQVQFAPSVMYEYADMKNQYGISNTSGQLLVNGIDATNFIESADMSEFVKKYGVPTTTNPQYETALQMIYGQNYNTYYDTENNAPRQPIDSKEIYEEYTGLREWLNAPNSNWDGPTYNNWLGKVGNIPQLGGEAGSYGDLIYHITNPPAYPGDKPTPPSMPEMPEMPAFGALAAAYNSAACHSAVSASSSGIWHMEHNLCALMWNETNGAGTDGNGNRIAITNSKGTITVTPTGGQTNNSIYSGHSPSGTDKAINLLAAFEDASDYQCVRDIKQQLIDLYCNVINYYDTQEHGYYTLNSSEAKKTPADLMTEWNQFYTDLNGLADKAALEWEEKVKKPLMEQYYRDLEVYNVNLENWNNAWNQVKAWSTGGVELYGTYLEDLRNLPLKEIPDEDNPKTQWYINLWHRMNGESETKSVEGMNGKYYKELEDNLYNSPEWLKFALEHGVVALEQVIFVEEAEKDTGLKHSKWEHTIHTAAVDISHVQDDVAIARAEAEYNKKVRDIESKDKQYDLDIKKLDTEHNALQTEYESIQTVIQKNVDRSFKAFS